MIKQIVDHRYYPKTSLCDAVLEICTNLSLSEEDRIIKGFESEEIDYILRYAQNLSKNVIVYIYDLNSKPLK
jgi:hypothetical protein